MYNEESKIITKKIMLVSSSLNKHSMSFVGMKKVEELAREKGLEVSLIDLREYEIPFCDARKFEEYPEDVKKISKILEKTDYIVFGMPVYCYSLSGVLKNFLDIFAKEFMQGKKFGILEQAGTKLSYLAANDIQKILGFEAEALPVFPVVLTDYSSYDNGKLTDKKAIDKINALLDNLKK